jgi:hypothetical protein
MSSSVPCLAHGEIYRLLVFSSADLTVKHSDKSIMPWGSS